MKVFGKSKGGGRRAAERVNAPVLAIVSTMAEDHRAALVNISSVGARLCAPGLPGTGEEVIFRAEKVSAFGRVVWSDEGQCGVEFDGPIGAADVDRLRSEVDLWGLAGLTAEERAAAEQWDLGVSP